MIDRYFKDDKVVGSKVDKQIKLSYLLDLSAFACCGFSFLRMASVALWTVATSSSARELTTYSDREDLIDSSWKRRFSFSRSANNME